MAVKSLADLLFGSYRRRVLTLLLLERPDALHVRAIARLSGVPAGSLHRELKLLAEVGLLIREPSGNQVLYRANPACPGIEEIRQLLRKTEAPFRQGLPKREATAADRIRIAKGLLLSRKMVENLAHRHQIARLALFGSAARDELGPDSDIDLLVEFEDGAAPTLGSIATLREDLAALFGRKVDLATPSVMNNPYRRRAILEDIREIYAS